MKKILMSASLVSAVLAFGFFINPGISLAQSIPVPENSLGTDAAGRNPSGGFNVGESTGSFSYDYQIPVPPGRAGMNPDLSLQYNHQLQNVGSMVGYGWSLNIPYIQRENRFGADEIYSHNNFLLSLGGVSQLVPVSVDGSGYGTYGKMVESNFLKIEYTSTTDTWLVTDKSGTVYTFGSSASTRQDNPSNSSQIYKWMLEEVRDTNDNFIRYEYYKDSGQIYPKKIFYTGHDSTDGIFEVDFETFATGAPTQNNSLTTSYQSGFFVQTKFLLDSIDVKIDGDLVASHQLHFTTGQSKYLLATITPTFYEGETPHIKDEVEFTYSYEPTSYTLAEPGYYQTPDDLDDTPPSLGLKNDLFIDLNGDSLTDYVRVTCNSSGVLAISVGVNDGVDGWDSSGYSTTLSGTYSCNTLYGVYHTMPVSFVNLDGDNLVDMATDNHYYTNTGSGWATSTASLPVSLQSSHSGSGPLASQVMFRDMNNDGYDDLIYNSHPNGYTAKVDVYIRDESSGDWDLDADYTKSAVADYSDCFFNGGDPFGYTDINNDGLTDVFYSFECSFHDPSSEGEAIYLNTGTGLTTSTAYSSPALLSFFSDSSTAIQKVNYLSDFNQDGVGDYGSYERKKWTTVGGPKSSGALNLFGTVFDTGTLSGHGYFDNGFPVAVADVNGDQIQDVIHNYGTTFDLYLGRSVKPDVLVDIDNQSGSHTHIDYGYSGSEKDESGDLENPELPFNINVVKEVVVDNGDGELQSTQYFYRDGKTVSYLADSIRDVVGFGEVEKDMGIDNLAPDENLKKNIEVYHLAADDGLYLHGRLKQAKKYDFEDTPFAFSFQHFTVTDLGGDRKFVGVATSTNTDLTDTEVSTGVEYTYDAYGNILTEKKLGLISVNTTTGAITNLLAGDERTTTYEYAQDSAKHILALPKSETISDGLDSREKNYYYDGLAYGEVDYGNLTKEDFIINDVEVNKTYNSYGLLSTITDAKGNVSTTTYDALFMYPAQSINPLLHTSETSFDLLTGTVAIATTTNDFVTHSFFDAYSRITEVKISDPDSPSELVTSQTVVYGDDTYPRYKQTTNYLDDSTSVVSREYKNGLGQVIQTKVEMEGGDYATTDITYDAFGRVAKKSLPYITESVAYTTPDDTKPAIYYAYDVLDRTLSEVTSVGTTTYQYDGLATMVTDANDHDKQLTKDAYGNLVSVNEYNGASTYTTEYDYNGFNELVTITDALDNVRNFTYDDLGRRVTAQDLHAIGDSTYGIWTYDYDKNGNVVSSTNPLSQTVNYSYDALNRVMAEDYAGHAGVEVSYGYDACSNGVGLLCAATSTDAVIDFAYDVRGLKTQEAALIDSELFTTAYDYDLQGNITLLTYPDNSQVRYSYNTAGLLESIEQKEDGEAFGYIVEDFDYNAQGQNTYQKNANGTETVNTYDPEQLYRLTRRLTKINTEGEFDISAFRTSSMFDGLVSDDVKVPDEVTEPAPASNTVRALLAGKSATEKRSIKGEAIAEQVVLGKYQRTKYDIEIVDVKPIEQGVVVFARAWEDGKQIGFGRTGDVDIERFIIINPPILVDSPSGDIVKENINALTGERSQRRLKEDPLEAILQSLEHTISVKVQKYTNAKIVEGKVGNTTTTVYPDANPETTSVDGYLSSGVSNSTWNDSHDMTTGTGAYPSAGSDNGVLVRSSDWLITRSVFLFDTSSLGSGQGIDSAVFSAYHPQKFNTDDDGNDFIVLVQSNPASNTNLVTADFDQVGNTIDNPTEGASRIDVSSITTGQYTNHTLNSTGRGWINKTGVTKLGMREGHDVLDNPISGEVGVEVTYADTSGTTQDPKLVIEHSTANQLPEEPSDLEAEGATNPSGVADLTPELSAIYEDNDSGDQAIYFRIQVSTTTGVWTNLVWDSGKTAMATTTEDTRSPEISYAGDDIEFNNTYYWRIKFWDDSDGEGEWSTETAYFTMGEDPNIIKHQDLYYVYDAVGNITQITDDSDNHSAKVVNYLYDDLNRLTSASSTNATSGPDFLLTFSYDAIGNITNKSDQGDYLYEGDEGSSYANPHAVTEVDGTTYSYDRNGNLLSDSVWTHTWNYKNQLLSSGNGAATSTYGYDYAGQRVTLDVGALTTVYPNKYYNTDGATSTKHIFTPGGTLVATIENEEVTFSIALVSKTSIDEENIEALPDLPEETKVDDPEDAPEIKAEEPLEVNDTDEPVLNETMEETQIDDDQLDTEVTPTPSDSIRSLLVDKSATEKRIIKGQAIAKQVASGTYSRERYDIEIVNIKPFEKGVVVFARAWEDGKQIGFGAKGDVDIERFIIVNPPILVESPSGDITKESTSAITGKRTVKQFKEDPLEAMLQSLEHIIEVKKQKYTDAKIIEGKVGNTTTTVYPDANPESTSVDGYIHSGVDHSTWDSSHDATTGSGVYPSADYDNGVLARNGDWLIARSIFLFDTSSLGSGEGIDNAVFSAYHGTKYNGDNDGDDFIVLVQSSPASDTNLVTADFDQVGAINNPTEGASRIDITSITTGQYTSHTLNATGIGWINKTGITKLGMREGHDVLDHPVSGDSGVEVYYADTSGTTQDPKLVIEHSTLNHNPGVPTNLEAEGSTNPTGVTDATPELSAIYHDIDDTGDLAIYYQIQVSTTTGVWTNLVWDSGKTAMATTTEGTRSPEIAYSGTGLEYSTTYYWRIKFWDDEDNAGAWSTETAYFVLTNISSTVVKYIHVDHLGGTHVVTDATGEQIELNDYYPFGELRLDEGTFDEQRKFTGHEYDEETDLTYANARYYNQDVGKFISQDPVFLAVGDGNKFNFLLLRNAYKPEYDDLFNDSKNANVLLYDYLAQPQSSNSYSYVSNNPLNYTDPLGESETAEKIVNWTSGRGWKTDTQLTDTSKIPTQISSPRSANGQQTHISSPELSSDGTTIGPSRPQGASYGQRRSISDSMNSVAEKIDISGVAAETPGLAVGITGAVASGALAAGQPQISAGAITAYPLIEASVQIYSAGASFVSYGLNVISNWIIN